MPKKRSISSMVSRQFPLPAIEHEMSKCVVLCASCHQKTERGVKEALDDLYHTSTRYYKTYYPPGEEAKTQKLIPDDLEKP